MPKLDTVRTEGHYKCNNLYFRRRKRQKAMISVNMSIRASLGVEDEK